jgi:aminoglycoside phosphotransferase family enzyme
MTDTEQKAAFELLADPATHGGAEVTRFDTHAASVFLAGRRAYKVKRAVRFPFLDYSTLEKRKEACLAELKVNQRFAPKLYHRVVPINRDGGGGLKLDGPGEPVEWAVEMTRFDEAQTLDHVAERGG